MSATVVQRIKKYLKVMEQQKFPSKFPFISTYQNNLLIACTVLVLIASVLVYSAEATAGPFNATVLFRKQA